MPQSDLNNNPAPQYDETSAPQNPPNSVLQPAARRGALAIYLGGIIALFAIVGAVLIFRTATTHFGDQEIERPGDVPVGTSGQNTSEQPGVGGFNPTPDHDSTRSELEFRGTVTPVPGPAGSTSATQPLNELGSVLDGTPSDVVGRSIVVRDVTVERALVDSSFWVRDGDARVEIVAPAGTAVSAGQRVNVSGVVEQDPGGSVRIRATTVNVQ